MKLSGASCDYRSFGQESTLQMIEYHIFWIIFALLSGGGYWKVQEYDCQKQAEVQKVETKFVGLTCYTLRDGKWVK
jgi:hypothetical protein